MPRHERHARQECLSLAEAEVEFFGQDNDVNIIPKDNAGTQGVSKDRKETWKNHLPQGTWTPKQRAVGLAQFILLILLVVLLLYFPFSFSADSNTANFHTNNSNPAISYTADTVTLHALDSESFSLTGSVCGDDRCSSHFDDAVTDVLITADSRVVLIMQHFMLVQSSAGLHTVRLSCQPVAVTPLPSSVLAFICPSDFVLRLVSLDPTDHEIQRVQTDKQYWYVATHPLDNTLIGATGYGHIDLLTLQGKVLRTLVHSHNIHIDSLTAAGAYLLVTNALTKQVHRIHLLASDEHSVEALAGTIPDYPSDTAGDSAGNVFVVLFDGSVWVRGSQGQYRQLRAGLGEGEEYNWCRIALRGHRLLLLTVTRNGANYLSVITEYQLVRQ